MNSPPPSPIPTALDGQFDSNLSKPKTDIRLNKADQKALHALLKERGRDLEDFRGENGDYDYPSIISWTLNTSVDRGGNSRVGGSLSPTKSPPDDLSPTQARHSARRDLIPLDRGMVPRPLLARRAESTGVDLGTMVSSSLGTAAARVLTMRRPNPPSPIRHEHETTRTGTGTGTPAPAAATPRSPLEAVTAANDDTTTTTDDDEDNDIPGPQHGGARALRMPSPEPYWWWWWRSPRLKPCHVMIALLVAVLAGSGAMGLYYTIARDRMGDGFTAAGWLVAAAALLEAAYGAHHFADGRCRCWRPPRPLEHGAVVRTRTLPCT